jgi:chromosome partitioning protein
VLVIALCQTKGGSGKSTIAECLAVHAAKTQTVQILDLDPQASTTKWWRRRKGPANPMLVPDIKSMAMFMASLKKKGAPDVLIIDTPGSMLGVIRDAVGVADVIVIPLAPSVKDWEAMDVVENIVNAAKKRDRALYVINRFRVGTDTSAEAIRALTQRVANRPLAIGMRTAYEKADAMGLSGPEINAEAAKEIDLVWSTIRRLATHV